MMLIYAVPVITSAWYCGMPEGIIVAVGTTVSWFLVNLTHSQIDESNAILLGGILIHLGTFILIACIVSLQVSRRAGKRKKMLL